MAHMQQKVVKTCQVHSHKQLTIYCFDCKRAICFACYNEDHQEHKCDDVISAARDTKAGMLEQCQAIRGTSLPTLSANIQTIKADEALSSQNLENHLEEIDAIEEDAIRTLKDVFSKHRKDAKDKHDYMLSKAKGRTKILEHLHSEIDRRTKTLEEEFTVLTDYDILELNQELKDKLVMNQSKAEEIPIYDVRLKDKTLSTSTLQSLTNIANDACTTTAIHIRKKGCTFLDEQMKQRSGPPPTSDMAFARYQPRDGRSKRKLVASLSIGSRFWGFVYSSKENPHRYFPQIFNSGGAKESLNILLKANLQVEALGNDAERKNAAIKAEEASEDYYFIDDIQAPLFEKNTNFVKDEKGRGDIPVQRLWEITLNYLIEYLQKECNRGGDNNKVDDFDIVISLPSFWKASIWDFVLGVALKTGIKNDQLSLISEAEAACIFADLEGSEEKKGPCIRDGEMVIVVDIGASTKMDCLRKRGNIFVEVVKPAMVKIGGQTVVETFENFMEGIVGSDVYQRFRATDPEDHFDLLRSFKIKQRKVRLSTLEEKVNITIPSSLVNICKNQGKDLMNLLGKSKHHASLSLLKDKLRILESTFAGAIFSDVIDCITKHVLQFIDTNKLQDIQTMVLIGGFSNCALLQKEIQDTFPKKRIHIPDHGEMAPLKGGVLFGHYYAASKRS